MLASERKPASASAERCSALPWPNWCVDIGRPRRDAEREVRQQRRDEVGARVDRLGDEPEAVRRQAGAELEHDERRGGGNRDER